MLFLCCVVGDGCDVIPTDHVPTVTANRSRRTVLNFLVCPFFMAGVLLCALRSARAEGGEAVVVVAARLTRSRGGFCLWCRRPWQR